jgi:hypothetical protein
VARSIFRRSGHSPQGRAGRQVVPPAPPPATKVTPAATRSQALAHVPPEVLSAFVAIASSAKGSVPPPFSGGSLYESTVLADHPLVYWKMDDLSGRTMTDSSGNGNNTGTYGDASTSSPTLNQTPLISTGRSVLLDGSTQSCAWPQTVALSSGNATSFEAWIKTSANTGTPEMVCADDTGPLGGRFVQFRLSTGVFQFILFDSGGGSHTATGSTTVSDNTALHIVGTYDGTTMLAYVNGVQDATLTATFTLPDAASTPVVKVGARFVSGIGFSNFFTGNLDEVAIYTHALSAARVAAHYAARNS